MSNWVNGNLKGSLSVGQGRDGKSLEYMWRGTELGIRQEGEEEYQFVDLALGGGNGREVELQVGNGFIQWRYKGEESWNNLISLDSLKGETGPQGPIGEQGAQGPQGPPGKDGITPDMTEFEKKINEQYDNIEKKVNDHITNHPQGGGGNASIDDTTISKDSTWSSEKIEDFVHTNDDVVWSTVQGENLSVDYTKEGYLREVEIWGNTIQDESNLEDIQHLGELYVDEEGQPILDELGREPYKVEIESCNNNGWFSFDSSVVKSVGGTTTIERLENGEIIASSNGSTNNCAVLIDISSLPPNTDFSIGYSYEKLEGENIKNVETYTRVNGSFISSVSNKLNFNTGNKTGDNSVFFRINKNNIDFNVIKIRMFDLYCS